MQDATDADNAKLHSLSVRYKESTFSWKKYANFIQRCSSITGNVGIYMYINCPRHITLYLLFSNDVMVQIQMCCYMQTHVLIPTCTRNSKKLHCKMLQGTYHVEMISMYCYVCGMANRALTTSAGLLHTESLCDLMVNYTVHQTWIHT